MHFEKEESLLMRTKERGSSFFHLGVYFWIRGCEIPANHKPFKINSATNKYDFFHFFLPLFLSPLFHTFLTFSHLCIHMAYNPNQYGGYHQSPPPPQQQQAYGSPQVGGTPQNRYSQPPPPNYGGYGAPQQQQQQQQQGYPPQNYGKRDK